MTRVAIEWAIEGDEAGQYLDLEASLTKFRELVA
jgi:hypothetical protein